MKRIYEEPEIEILTDEEDIKDFIEEAAENFENAEIIVEF